MSCEKEMDKHYEIPEWLKGSAEEVLKSQGNYSLFLQAVDRAGYGDLLKGKGIITVVAPSDNAFGAWLTQHQYGSIENVPLKELKKTIAFHFIYYAYDKSMLADYRPEGVNNTEQSVNDAGLYYKFRTKSSDSIGSYFDRTAAPNTAVPIRKVYHKERFVPVLSPYLFRTKGIDAAYNYRYFYPSGQWEGNNEDFRISNASVSEYAILADNGYIYTVNEVLEPLETIFTELNNSPNNSVFVNMYDRFADFVYDAATSTNYGKGDSLFLYYHADLPKIASEWSYNGEGGYPDYAELGILAKTAYNVFAPSDQSLQNFFNDFWSDYYSKIEDVPFIPIKYLLDNHVAEGDIIFPQEIEQGKIVTKFGNKVVFDTQNTFLKKICVNGTLYGLNDVMIPRMFGSVTAPLFRNPAYNMFLTMMSDAEMIIPLMSEDKTNFSLFIPTDRLIEDYTTYNGYRIFYQNLNPNKYGGQNVMMETADGSGPMSRMVKTLFATNHIGTKLFTEVGNKKVYKTMNSFQYLLVEDDKIYSTNLFNNYYDQPATLKKIYTAYNGESYEVSGDNTMALLPDMNVFKDQITRTSESAPSYYFRLLAETAGFHLSSPKFGFLQGERFIVFIPSNEAILTGLSSGIIPFDPAGMAEYLQYYFVNTNLSSLSDYPFPGAGIQGELTSFRYTSDRTRGKMTLIDDGNSLRIRDGKGDTVNVIGVFPNIYSDGAVYLIDGLLSIE
jgi:uncharacterized surface protein with fasciclin (FAS1) repeats